jgi:hypothetical protein
MTNNEIKKLLYKENPSANLLHLLKGNAYYACTVNGIYILFEVPVSEMGDTRFWPQMDSKLLIRYIVNNPEVQTVQP